MTPLTLLSGLLGICILMGNLSIPALDWWKSNSDWQDHRKDISTSRSITLVKTLSDFEHIYWLHQPEDFFGQTANLKKNSFAPKICRDTFQSCSETTWSSSMLILETHLAFEFAKKSPGRTIVEVHSEDLSCTYWAEFKRHREVIEWHDCRLWWQSQVYWSNIRLLGNYVQGYGVFGFYSVKEIFLFTHAILEDQRFFVHLPSLRQLIY